MRSLITTTVLTLSAFALRAQPGALDPTFGNGGALVTQLSLADELARAMTVQPDGKIVVVSGRPAGQPLITVLRYMPNGDMDTTFGTAGTATVTFGTGLTMGNDVLVQPDGKIVVGGYTDPGAGEVLAVARLNTDGSMDNSFSADGMAVFNVPFCPNEQVQDMALRPDGRLLVVGVGILATHSIVMTASFTSSGLVDTGFNSPNGYSAFDFGFDQKSDRATAVSLLADGSAIVSGSSVLGTANDFLITKLDPLGAFVTSGFNGNAGFLRHDMGTTMDLGETLVVQPNGRSVLAGVAGSEAALLGADALGLPDATFGTNGEVIQPVATFSSNFTDAVLHPWDKIIAVGGSSDSVGDAQITVVRYLENGSLDPAFGNGGIVRTNVLGLPAGATAVALQPDGKIVVAGWASDGNDTGIALARFENDVALDVPDVQGRMPGPKAFPVPFMNELIMSSTTNGAPFSIRDATGRTVAAGHTTSGTTRIATGHLAPGAYWVSVDGSTMRVLKL